MNSSLVAPTISAFPATALQDLEYAYGQIAYIHLVRDSPLQRVRIDGPNESRVIDLPLDTDLSDYANQQICLMKCDGKVLVRRAGA